MKNEIKRSNSISDIQAHLKKLYSNEDLTVEYIYGYLTRTIGYLCKNISLDKERPEHFIRPISWLISLCNKLDINLGDVFTRRFPMFCPYCLSSPCICFKTNKSPVFYVPAHKVQEELDWKYQTYKNNNSPISFDECIKNINIIYPSNEIVWHYGGPWHHFVKMQEEVSEIHEAVSKFTAGKKPIETVGEEVSDTLAWIVGAWAIVNPKISLDGSIIDYYIDGCPVCNAAPCRCKPYSDRAAELIDIEKLMIISNQLSELKNLVPNKKDKISELEQSIAAAISSQSAPVTAQAVKQTIVNLDKIKQTINTADSIGKKANSILGSALAILSKLTMLT